MPSQGRDDRASMSRQIAQLQEVVGTLSQEVAAIRKLSQDSFRAFEERLIVVERAVGTALSEVTRSTPSSPRFSPLEATPSIQAGVEEEVDAEGLSFGGVGGGEGVDEEVDEEVAEGLRVAQEFLGWDEGE